MNMHYDNRSTNSIHSFTNCVVDGYADRAHFARVLPKDEFLAEIRRRANVDADIARALNLPSSRIAELFSGKRGLRYDEAKILADRFLPEGDPGAVSATVLTSAFATLLESVGIPPFEDERAQKLARRFPDALQRASILHANFAEDDETPPEVAALDPGVSLPKA